MKRFLFIGLLLAFILSITAGNTLAGNQIRAQKGPQNQSCQNGDCDCPNCDADCPQNCIQQQDQDRDNWDDDEEPGWGLSWMWKMMHKLLLCK